MRRIARSLPSFAAIVFVLAAYTFFASAGTFELRRTNWEWTIYGGLAKGFLNGGVSSAHTPDPALLAVEDPYDPALRGDVPFLWDASLYGGKYYVYFSPVPVLLFTIPFSFVARAFPSDPMSAAFFCAWSFLASCAFLRRALAPQSPPEELRGTPRNRGTLLPLWYLVAGLGHIVPFVLLDVRVYEIAIACGMAMSATWAYTFLRFLERPSARSALLMGLFLALTIATRPNLIVLIAVVAAAVLLLRDRRRIVRFGIAAAIPVAIVGSLYAAYNYARFGSVTETGLSYQLTVMPMKGETPCRLCSRGDVARFFNTAMHYVFLPPKFVSTFPFVDMKWNDAEPAVSFPATPEQIAGFAPLTPLAMLGTALAALLLLARRVTDESTRASLFVLGGAWIVLLTLSTCRWLTARYSLDFYLLLVIASIVAIERGLVFLSSAGVAVRPLRVLVVALALYSIVVGLLLGFRGPRGTFAQANPQLFERIVKRLH